MTEELEEHHVVGVFLVDRRGWVLLQERDEHAPVAAEQWGVVGGHVEPGEPDEDAVLREIEEETGLRLDLEDLEIWFSGTHHQAETRCIDHWRLWVGAVDLTDDDIVVGEGRQIVFVDPAGLDRLDLAETTRRFLTDFLASPVYARLTG